MENSTSIGTGSALSPTIEGDDLSDSVLRELARMNVRMSMSDIDLAIREFLSEHTIEDEQALSKWLMQFFPSPEVMARELARSLEEG